MKYFVAVLAFAAVAFADVAHIRNPDETAQILRQETKVEPEGFAYGYDTSNGISAHETGSLISTGPQEAAIAVEGRYAYTGPDGVVYTVTYKSDKDGYQAFGDHLPTPPAPLAIPDYIQRSIEYILAHPPKPEPVYKA